MTALKNLALSSITLDPEIQSRQQLNQEVIAEYAEAMSHGATFPPVIVFYDGSNLWLADGFHRIAATQVNGDLEILAERKSGYRRDAALYAVGANTTHGFQRTNADKRRAVKRLLQDLEWCQWSDNAIAQKCGVSHSFVGRIRQQSMSMSTFNGVKSTSRKGADGRVINISNIGQYRKRQVRQSDLVKSPRLKESLG